MGSDLVPVSLKLLYDGMIAPHDIYNADGDTLIIRKGNELRISQIDAIKRINKERDVIYVSRETQRLLFQKNPGAAPEPPKEKTTYQAKLEKVTGYAEIKSETLNMLNEMAQTNTVSHDKMNTVSLDISHKVNTLKPEIILHLINTLAPIDEYLQRHCMNVSMLNGLTGKWLGLDKETIDMLVLVGLVHDCGKVSVPQEVLNAPRKLTPAEFEVIKMHTVFGYEMLSEFPDVVRYGARGHHEKVSGAGYPDSLAGDKISLAARITAVSDIYDAMVSQRVYKDPRNPFHIVSWIKKLRESELEATIVDIFTENLPKEFVGKRALLSDGKVGIVHELDLDDLEYPFIKIDDRVFKSNENIFCIKMFMDGETT
jgi:HD-GYP domain-containing protein (c-di-GMP phosphodiesterase class II)